MLKTAEIKMAINKKIEDGEKLQAENKWEELAKVVEEIKQLKNELKTEEEKQQASFNSFLKNAKQVTPSTEDAATLRNRAFNKLVLNPLRTFPEPLTDEEKTAYFNLSGSPGQPAMIESINTKGGYLVPTEQMATLQEIRKELVSLKNYVNVVSTNFTSGRWPVYTQENLKFQSFAEMTPIAESDLTISQATYTIDEKGMILPVSNQLIADSNINIISFMGRQLADAAVRTENEAIIQPLNKLITGETATGIAEATTITSYKSLNTAMFKTLDGTYYNAAKIFTNQDGFLWLSNLDDAQNRPLFVPDVTNPNKYFYRGKEIVVVPNLSLPNITISNKVYAPFFVGDMASYLTFFERQGLELATSSELYFRQYGTALRAVIRFGIIVTNPYAMTALKVEV